MQSKRIQMWILFLRIQSSKSDWLASLHQPVFTSSRWASAGTAATSKNTSTSFQTSSTTRSCPSCPRVGPMRRDRLRQAALNTWRFERVDQVSHLFVNYVTMILYVQIFLWYIEKWTPKAQFLTSFYDSGIPVKTLHLFSPHIALRSSWNL